MYSFALKSANYWDAFNCLRWMVYLRISAKLNVSLNPLINKIKRKGIHMPEILSVLSLPYFLAFPCNIIDKYHGSGAEQQMNANINVTVGIQMNRALFSPLPSTNNCAGHKCIKIKSRDHCHHVVVNFFASAHAAYSSLYINTVETQQIWPNTKGYWEEYTHCGSHLASLFKWKTVNLGYACSKFTKATCVGCISLQQYDVSLGFHWWNGYLDNLMCLQ